MPDLPEHPTLLTPREVMERLHAQCSATLALSTSAGHGTLVGSSYLFSNDLEAWNRVLKTKREEVLYRTASHEYAVSLLNACEGQYRNAFKGLRLVLELCVQGVYLSANLVQLDEWLKGDKDTLWISLMDEDNGVVSKRFCRAFFPELVDHAANFREMTKTLYRELSECIHGNIPNQIPLPITFAFNLDTFKIWHQKASIVRLIVLFYFGVRYLKTLGNDERGSVESGVLDQLGHIEGVRGLFGGPIGA
jgi:hypothetical protein